MAAILSPMVPPSLRARSDAAVILSAFSRAMSCSQRRSSASIHLERGPNGPALPVVLALLVLALLSLSSACVRSPQPCRSPEHCSESSECLAHRCVPLGAEPVTPGTRRLVVEAAAVAVARRGAVNHAALPATVTLGGPGAGAEQLLLRFPRSWASLDVQNAFLLLSPAQSADPTGADVQVQVALASEPWSSGTL